MKQIVICACGIAADDCDYHKPETKEYFVGKLYKDVNYRYLGNGQWEIESDYDVEPETLRQAGEAEAEPETVRRGSNFVIPADPKIAFINDVAKRVGDWHYRRQMEMMVGVFGSNDVG